VARIGKPQKLFERAGSIIVRPSRPAFGQGMIIQAAALLTGPCGRWSCCVEQIAQWEKEIRIFLGNQLKLELNERRKLRPVGDGIDFLGYIVRPDYLLVRRRVIGALRERLKAAEAALIGTGMAEHLDGHSVFPWPQALIGEVLQWLNSYLGHIKKASGHRLMESIRRRFWWLDEYFVREGNKATLRCPIPRFTLRFSQQKRWFQKHLPGHVLLIRKGVFWEIDVEACGTDLSDFHWPDRIHFRRKRQVKSALWKADVPVAWIGETGRRLGRIAERALVCRWTCEQG